MQKRIKGVERKKKERKKKVDETEQKYLAR
jgi:hypothetical protein